METVKVRIGLNDMPDSRFPYCIIEENGRYVGPFNTLQDAIDAAKGGADVAGYEVEIEVVDGKIT